jgi:hypothetical protein
MPVKFYPEKPLDLLEKYILKEDGSPLYGEIDVYRQLHSDLSKSIDDWYVWHDIKLPYHSDEFNPYNKVSAQVDFLILNKEGIIVLEVKGGPISVKESDYYYGKNFEQKIKQDPFRQAEGYKYTLKDKVLNTLGNCFFCHAVIFPHVDYQFESPLINSHLLWTKLRATSFDNSLALFITDVFTHCKNEHKKRSRTYPRLNTSEIDAARKILNPIISDRSKFQLSSTLEWLQINNLEILEGLNKNKRIMIEGPPGSGKTTIAKGFIDLQVGKRGIYLCWNNLLMHYTKKVLQARDHLRDVQVTTINRFLKILDRGLPMETVLALNEDQFYELIKAILDNLEEQHKLPAFDYMVIDEGQDLFDRGIDLLINKLCGYNRDGLSNGTALVLYDIDQSYSSSSRNLCEISDLLCAYFAHYKLNEVKRSAQNPSIKKLASNILGSPDIILTPDLNIEFPGIRVTRFKNLEAIKKHIVANYLAHMRNEYSSLRGGQCVILIEAFLLREKYKNEPGMHYWLTIKDVEEVDENNVGDKSNKLRYTSILKFKGLEKENVFLVISNPSERNKYELYVGITRAICNLEILIVQ